MTLVELCEPLFQYICRLNRSVRKGLPVETSTVRSEIKAILADMKAKAATTPNLVANYEKVELTLLFFVDFMVRDFVGGRWQELAAERKELAGDERFFDLLDETLKEQGDAANERLAVYYVCLGLGFTGWYQGQPEFLRKKMLEISARIRGIMDADTATRICPEGYEHVNTANLVEPPGRKLVGVGIALVCLFILVFGLNISMYLNSERTMAEAVEHIKNKGGTAAPAGKPKSTEGLGS
jgi:hypothetical protein